MSDEPEMSRPLRPLGTIFRPTFAIPAGAWDVHLERWAPSSSVRQRILVNNPNRLFGIPT
jgi:hypothetical protein